MEKMVVILVRLNLRSKSLRRVMGGLVARDVFSFCGIFRSLGPKHHELDHSLGGPGIYPCCLIYRGTKTDAAMNHFLSYP